MNEIIERALLYDFYKELLTKKQITVYELYYLDDLSLGEIAEIVNISRQGVHDALKRCEKQLYKYEEKLQLVTKFLENKKRVHAIYDITRRVKQQSEQMDERLIDGLNQIETISKQILDDL